jgi:hypothetical protein
MNAMVISSTYTTTDISRPRFSALPSIRFLNFSFRMVFALFFS